MQNETQREAFMREALAVARRSFARGGGPFGAVIVLGDQIVGTGMSLARLLSDPTAHAEVSAIRAAALKLQRIDLHDCVAYTSAEPCPMCLSALYWSQIKTIFYGSETVDATPFGFEDSYVYEELQKPGTERGVACHQLLRDEALDLLRNAMHQRPYPSFLPSSWRPGSR
jgi:tRNA(Arg) A34 adenosine deaminase TadA